LSDTHHHFPRFPINHAIPRGFDAQKGLTTLSSLWAILFSPIIGELLFNLKRKYSRDETKKGYDTFGNAAKEKALKVILTN
jgi:hypothetical protein